MGFRDKRFSIKSDKARIAKIQDTVNHELDKVEGTCVRAYVAWIAYAATSNDDVCTIGIFLLRSDLTHNHGVENIFSSVLRDIFKSNDVKGVCALYTLVLGAP